MKKYQFIKSLLLVGSLLLGGISLTETNNKPSSFNENIEAFLTLDEVVKESMVGISIRNAETNEILFEKNGNIPFRPASNLKLFTGASALDILGEEYTFKTLMSTNGRVDGNKLKGDLYLVGRGDVTLQTSDLNRFAEVLSKRGIERIDGDIIGDDHWYDDVRYSKDLIWEDEETYYGAQISALTLSPTKDYDSGTVIVDVTPGNHSGDPAKVTLFPKTSYVEINNTASTGKEGETNTISIHRKHGENTIEISGNIPVNSGRNREWISVWNPTKYTTHVFKEILEENGINVEGKTKTGIAPSNSEILYESESIPLKELLVPFMKLSNNGHAEVFVKEIGKVEKGEGSWEKGLEVLQEEMMGLKTKRKTIQFRDGSGLSQANLIPPNYITNLLFYIQEKPWFNAFKNSLPIAGNPDQLLGGTLRYRMNDLPSGVVVYAKTGTLTSVSALSGYVEDANGRSIIFSIMVNNVLNEDDAKKFEDRFLKLLINEMELGT